MNTALDTRPLQVSTTATQTETKTAMRLEDRVEDIKRPLLQRSEHCSEKCLYSDHELDESVVVAVGETPQSMTPILKVGRPWNANSGLDFFVAKERCSSRRTFETTATAL